MSMKDQRSIIPWQKISVADSDPLPLPEHIDEKELESLERSDRRPSRWTSLNEMENLNGRLTSIGRRSMIGWFVTLQIFSTIENLQRQEKKEHLFQSSQVFKCTWTSRLFSVKCTRVNAPDQDSYDQTKELFQLTRAVWSTSELVDVCWCWE